jgi:hypothetical protein
MGKLADYEALKRDLAFEYERELRAVRDALYGIARISGAEHTIDLLPTDGFVSGGEARRVFCDKLRAAVHGALLEYAQDLAREGLEYGVEQKTISNALNGSVAASTTVVQLQTNPLLAPVAELSQRASA